MLFFAMKLIAIASPLPSPLPTIAGRGGIFETASQSFFRGLCVSDGGPCIVIHHGGIE
jgi:hypothetical protein